MRAACWCTDMRTVRLLCECCCWGRVVPNCACAVLRQMIPLCTHVAISSVPAVIPGGGCIHVYQLQPWWLWQHAWSLSVHSQALLEAAFSGHPDSSRCGSIYAAGAAAQLPGGWKLALYEGLARCSIVGLHKVTAGGVSSYKLSSWGRAVSHTAEKEGRDVHQQ